MVKRRRSLPLKRASHRILIDEGMEPLWSWLQTRLPGTQSRELLAAARIGVNFLLGQTAVPSPVAGLSPVATGEQVSEPIAEATRWEAGDFAVPPNLGGQ